ncbi:probable ATP-dependent RNA helicase DDX28 [Tetranychus urticae]|nr:probable ATP-dependent RNA helicase DDX28 [Tetranychus urticae]
MFAVFTPKCHSILTVSQCKRLMHNVDTIPVITVPKYLESQVKRHERRKKQILEERANYLKTCGDRSKPVVTCKLSPKLNHYLYQKYPKDKKIPLASQSWKSGKYKGDVITIHPHAANPHFEEAERFDYTFKAAGLNDNIISAINNMGYFKPTQCQLRTIPEILKGLNVVCCAETGSGKTLAYLSPIMEKISLAKARGDVIERHPNAIIVLPSRELVHQIGIQARSFGSLIGVGVAPIVGGAPTALSHTGYDVIITTLGLIGEHTKRGVYSLNKVKTLVLDEADTLLDDTFSYGIGNLLSDLRFKSSENRFGTQLCLVSATIPQEIEEIIGGYVDFNSFSWTETQYLHRLMPHVKHVFLRLHKYDRPNKLLELVGYKLQNKKRIIIFNRKRSSCEWMYNHLNQSGFPSSHLHRRMDENERISQLQKFQQGETNVLCATDLASRGIDFKNVSDVVNYDSPHHVSDYLHRAGRTGRIGSRQNCTVTTFVCFSPDVDMLHALETSVRTNSSIQNVNGNIKSILKNLKRRKLSKYL